MPVSLGTFPGIFDRLPFNLFPWLCILRLERWFLFLKLYTHPLLAVKDEFLVHLPCSASQWSWQMRLISFSGIAMPSHASPSIINFVISSSCFRVKVRLFPPHVMVVGSKSLSSRCRCQIFDSIDFVILISSAILVRVPGTRWSSSLKTFCQFTEAQSKADMPQTGNN